MSNAGWEYRTIGIDFDVFKALTALRQSPLDTENDVIRRLLNIFGPSPSASSTRAPAGRSWVTEGVEFPHGTELRATYKGHLHTGHVDDGMLVVNGKRYTSPSTAA